MNNYEDVMERKREEIRVLSDYLQIYFEKKTLNSITDVVTVKRKLRTKLRHSVCDNTDLTNFQENVMNISGIEYEYSYQRYDGCLKVDFDTVVIPKIFSKKIIQRTLWTTSGMGAISSLLLAIYILNEYNCQYDDDIYFETYKLMHFLKLKSNKTNKGIIYIDSIQPQFFRTVSDLQVESEIIAIIVDTTCLDYQQSYKIISTFCKKNISCIVVRSHTKLDMLGTEYSKLGSVTYYIPFRIEHEKKIMVKNILKRNMDMLGMFGIWASPKDIPPFWNMSALNRLCSQRISALVKSNKYAYIKLKEALMKKIILPDHSLFILIPMKQLDTNILRKKLKIFVEMERQRDIPIAFATGFGFDIVVIDLYYDVISSSNFIRLAWADILLSDTETLIQDFARCYYEL